MDAWLYGPNVWTCNITWSEIVEDVQLIGEIMYIIDWFPEHANPPRGPTV